MKLTKAQKIVFILACLILVGICVHMLVYTKFYYMPMLKSIKNMNDIQPAYNQFLRVRNIDFGILGVTVVAGIVLLLTLRPKKEEVEKKIEEQKKEA